LPRVAKKLILSEGYIREGRYGAYIIAEKNASTHMASESNAIETRASDSSSSNSENLEVNDAGVDVVVVTALPVLSY